MPVIEVEELEKSFGDVRAVDGIDFSVQEGEIFGFLGPNGAGKTTTINVLTGLARKTAGSVRVLGHFYPRDLRRAQEGIGVVPDGSNLYPELSGKENLTFCGSLYGIRKEERERRAAELLDQFGLSGVAGRRFATYSKGMKRKLTIAAALIHRPRVLFLDEPTSGIDVASARQIRRILERLNCNGTTVFLTTHYIEEAERLCHRVAFIVDGRIVRVDSLNLLLEEVGDDCSLQFAVGGDAASAREVLSEVFPSHKASATGDGQLLLRGERLDDIIPAVCALHDAGVTVQEVRLLRPSLEDVFVRVTGIEAEEMTAHRGGGS